MLPFQFGQRPLRFSYDASNDDVPGGERALDVDSQIEPPHALDRDASRRPRSRRRYRSRNCRNFRQIGPYFQFTDPETDERETRRRQQLLDTHRRVQRLLEQHDLVEARRINARVYAISHATDTTRRFYELFMHGFDPVNHPDLSRRAEAFLRAAMHDNAVCTDFLGADMFLTQFRMATENHGSMAMQLQRVTHIGDDSSIQIKAEATTRFRITRVTLERMFPSLVQDEDFVQQLIGREYQVQYDKVFHFRLSDGRIFQHETRVDLCAALLEMVSDPFLALRMMEASSITQHGHWQTDEVTEGHHELVNALL